MSKKYKIGDTVFFNGKDLKIIEIIKGGIIKFVRNAAVQFNTLCEKVGEK